jgi:Tfp pilus assembly protein PilN
VGLAVVIHQAVSPWLVAVAHRQGGGHRIWVQLGGGQSVLAVVVTTTGGCRDSSPPAASQPRA